MLFLFVLSHCLGLAEVNRLILLVTSVRGSDHRQETHQPDPVFDTMLLPVLSDTPRRLLQIKSRSHIHKRKGTKKNKLNQHPQKKQHQNDTIDADPSFDLYKEL